MSELEQIVFQLITLSGTARSAAFEALSYAKKHDFEKSEEHIKISKESIVEAHNIQTNLIQLEARGEASQVNLLLVHAQDHLMTAMLAKDLIEEMICMQKQIKEQM